MAVKWKLPDRDDFQHWSNRPTGKLCLYTMLAGAAFCQSPAPVVGPSFEVAAIKPSSGTAPNSPYRGGGPPRIVGTNFEYRDVSLIGLIGFGYLVQSDHISGPRWLDDTRFDIVAKLPEGTTPRQTEQMTRSLLVDRFQLVSHVIEKPVSVYALKVGRDGIKFGASDPADTSRATCASGACEGYRCRGVSMRSLASRMSQSLWQRMTGLSHLPVVDVTGLSGTYDFDLPVSWETNLDGSKLEGCVGGASIFGALNDIGLTLKEEKQMQEFVVVDSVLRIPLPN